MRFILSVIMLVLLQPLSSSSQEISANATRPSAADNGYITARGYAEIETGWLSSQSLWSCPALLKVSVGSNLELGISATGLLEKPKGSPAKFGIPGAQLKWQAWEGESGAFASVVHVDWPSQGDPALTFYPVMSLKRGGIVTDIMIGGTFRGFGSTSQSSFLYAFCFSPQFESPLGVYGEVFGTLSRGSPAHAVDAGLLYSVSPGFIVDLAIGKGLVPSNSDWIVQAGFTSTIAQIFE